MPKINHNKTIENSSYGRSAADYMSTSEDKVEGISIAPPKSPFSNLQRKEETDSASSSVVQMSPITSGFGNLWSAGSALKNGNDALNHLENEDNKEAVLSGLDVVADVLSFIPNPWVKAAGGAWSAGRYLYDFHKEHGPVTVPETLDNFDAQEVGFDHFDKGSSINDLNHGDAVTTEGQKLPIQ